MLVGDFASSKYAFPVTKKQQSPADIQGNLRQNPHTFKLAHARLRVADDLNRQTHILLAVSMPLLVHCPNNCQIRLPSNRMGKVIRCVECQTPIRIPELDSPLLRTGNWVECRAKRAIKKTDQKNGVCETANQTSLPSPAIQTEPGRNGTAETCSQTKSAPPSSVNAVMPLEPPPHNARLLRAKPWRMVETLTSIDPEVKLTPIDLELEPASAVSTRTKDSQVQARSTANLGSNQAKPSVENVRLTHWLSLIRSLLWYETPADEDPSQTA